MTTGDILAAFAVRGRPRTKGSLKVITPRGKRPILIEDHSLSGPWRKEVARAARNTHPHPAELAHVPCALPVMVSMVFRFERPVTGKGVNLAYPILNAGVNASGDLDKLERNVLDALQDAKIIKDDCQVVGMSSTKMWTHGMHLPGVEIVVTVA